MDCTFAWLFRDVLDASSGPIYLWCDSSPQAGVDWLLSVFDYVDASSLQQCLEHYRRLFQSTTVFQRIAEVGLDDDQAVDWDVLAETTAVREEAGKFFKKALRRHRQMPMGLGSGATKLEHKCQALAIKFAHEANSFQSLRQIVGRVVSVTVDMGVEGGVADAQGGDVVSYLPPWIAKLDWMQEDAGLEAVHVPSHRIFPSALLSAGLDHIANNMQSDMDQHLQCWDTWLPGFKALCYLLSHKHLLVRLVARCVKGTPHAALSRLFETCIEPVAKWRWGTIVKTLPHILRLERALRIVWDQKKFGGDSHDDAFDCDIITKTVEDHAWWATAGMLLQLQSIGNLASGWGSRCPCHEWITDGKSELSSPSINVVMTKALVNTREVLQLDRGADGIAFDCPLKGKRAPELAAGRLLPRVNEGIDQAMGEVFQICSGVPNESREKIINDFVLGSDFIRMTLDIKVGHWMTLPWLFAGLCLPHEGTLHKDLAQKAVEEFDKLPAEPIYHHPLTWKILGPGSPLRSQVDALANGGDVLSNLPGLESEIAPLAMVPVVERIVEGSHSLVHRHTGYRKVTGAYVSCAHRLEEMNLFLDTDEGKCNFAKTLDYLRKPRRLAKAFRFQDHPLWLEIGNRPSKDRSGVQKTINAIVYSTDPDTMYVEHAGPRQKHKKRTGEAMNAKLALCAKARVPLSQDAILQKALTQHVQERLRVGEFYSFHEEEELSMQTLGSVLDLPSASPPEKDERKQDASGKFFKVVSVSAPHLRTVKSNRKRLSKGDIVVTLHQPDQLADGRCLVDTQPSGCTAPGDTVHVLSSAGIQPNQFTKLKCWARGSQCQFALPHFDTADASSLLQRFFDCHAVEGNGAILKASDEIETRLLQEICFEGWVIGSEEHGWRLAKAGLQQLRVCQSLDRPQPLCNPDPSQPLQDKTNWELLQQLLHKGWLWQKLPQKKRGILEPYALGGHRFWYTSGDTVRKEYLLCLLQSDSLLEVEDREVVRVIHHAMPVAYYQKILALEFDGAYMIADSKTNAETAEKIVGPREMPMIADEGIAWAPSELPGGSDRDLRPAQPPRRRRKRKAPPSQAPSSDTEALLAIDFDLVSDPGDWASGSGGDSSEDRPNADDSNHDASMNGPNGDAAPVRAVEAAPSEPAEEEAAPNPSSSSRGPDHEPIAREVQPETLVAWGAGEQTFRITWRKPSHACKFGAWQGTCPYHKKSATAKCTKGVNVSDDSAESRERCLRMVQHWLLCANKFNRASAHGAFNPRFDETPPAEVLLSRSESMQRAGSVKTDVELAEEPKTTPKPKPKRGSKAKAKPKAEAAADRDSMPASSAGRASVKTSSNKGSDSDSPASNDSSSSSSSSDSSSS